MPEERNVTTETATGEHSLWK